MALALAGVAVAATPDDGRWASPDLAGAALIKWSAASGGTGRATSQSVPQAATPTPVANGRDVTVSWSATTLSGGTQSAGYIVRRYSTANVLQTIGSSCQGVITTTSCTETNAPVGTWKYTVQPSHYGWLGTMSAYSPQTTVGTASLAFTSATTFASVPTTLSGTISAFAVGALTFRLDSATGPTLSGTPSLVPVGGSGSITVTIPVGTSDGPHSVFAIDTTGSAASAVFTFVDPPTLQALQMLDTNTNGKVETVQATFSRTLATYSAGVSPWTLMNVPSGGSLSAVTVSGATATLTISEGASAATTAVGAFTVALAANSGGIRTINGSVGSFAPTAPTDAAAPALLTMVMQDVNGNGKVDAVAMTLSETLASYTAGTTPWTLTSVPSNGALASVTVGTTTATLGLTEGAGAGSTAVGTFNVAVVASATGLRDVAGNQTVASRQPTDGAAPAVVSHGMYDVNLDGRVDRVTATFSETLATYSAVNAVWTLVNAPSGATVSTVAVSGSTATLDLTPGTGAATTAVGTFTVALLADPAGVRDAAGNLAGYAATAPTDLAAPAPTVVALQDANANGKVDRVTVTFSETLATYTAGTAPWTLTNVPSSGSLSTVTLSGATATLAVTEGVGAIDTSVGAMTIALASSATGIRDAALNTTSFAARMPTDSARPIVTALTDTNGTTDGLIQPGDTLVLTFSEPLLASSVPTSTSVTYTDPQGNGNDTLTISGITSGALKTGSNAYLSTNASSAAFAASAVTLSADRKTVTVTVGATCTGTGCAGLGTATTAGALDFVAATSLTDGSGNAAVGTKSVSLRLF